MPTVPRRPTFLCSKCLTDDESLKNRRAETRRDEFGRSARLRRRLVCVCVCVCAACRHYTPPCRGTWRDATRRRGRPFLLHAVVQHLQGSRRLHARRTQPQTSWPTARSEQGAIFGLLVITLGAGKGLPKPDQEIKSPHPSHVGFTGLVSGQRPASRFATCLASVVACLNVAVRASRALFAPSLLHRRK
jgi:hypothetical protein